ncbi:MAG: recombinase family protein [Clostridium sp.]
MRTVKRIDAKDYLDIGKRVRVCAYVRVSTNNKEQVKSYENQKEYYENKIRGNPNYRFVKVFGDCGVSGNRVDRPGFNEMMESVRQGKIDLIITKAISRFARNTIMLLNYIREFKEYKVGVIFEEQNINTLTGDGEMMLTVLGAIAEEERKIVSSNITWSLRKRYASGDVTIDTSRLLGYTKDKSGEIVKMIFEMYLDGLGSCTIAEILNEKNIKTYTKFKWGSNRILSILSNEKYKGDCLTQKTFVNSNGREVLNKGEMTKWYIENHHIPIIDRATWDRAEKLRLSKRLKVYEFTSLIICPFCGANLTRCSQEQKYISWICGTYLRKGKADCVGMRIREQDLKELAEKYKIDKPIVLIKEKKRNGKESFSFISPKEYFKR